MRLSGFERKIVDIITPVADDMGFRILWVEHSADTLTVYAENRKTGQLTLDECTALSREISPVLEVEDPIESAYRLNVSSPGIDRPLFTTDDFNRYNGLEVKIELDSLLDGQKRFRGRIIEADENTIRIENDAKNDGSTLDLPIASLYKAKLVMNDELIKITKERFAAAQDNVETLVEEAS